MSSFCRHQRRTDWNLLNTASPINTTHPLARGLLHWWLCAPGLLGGLVWRDIGLSTLRRDGTITTVTAVLFWNRSSSTPVAPHRGGYWSTKGNDAGYSSHGTLTDFYSNGTTAFTFACWWRRAVISSDSVAIGQGNTSQTHAEFLVWNDGIVYFLFPANGQGGNADCYPYYSQNDTNWHCSVYIYDGSQTGNANRFVCYMDGVQQTLTFTGLNSDPIPAQINFTPTGNFEIHRRVENTAETYDGYVNDCAIWNRPLTQAEAQLWYHSSLTGHPDLLRRFGTRRSVVISGATRTTRNTLASPLGMHLGRGLWTHGGSG